MKARFEVDPPIHGEGTEKRADGVDGIHSEPRYIDVESSGFESYDATERDFALSLETPNVSASGFVVTAQGGETFIPLADETTSHGGVNPALALRKEVLDIPKAHLPEPGAIADNSWREEVSARLSKYQSRRRAREPRYPSLRLKFEPLEPAAHDSFLAESSHSGISRAPSLNIPVDAIEPQLSAQGRALPLEPARILEFPRSLPCPSPGADELAEPVFERPRIMEAPNIVTVEPAPWGILIEPTEPVVSEKRPGFEMPLLSAGMGRRLLATGIDGLITLTGVALFGCVFWKVTALIPATRLIAGMASVSSAVLWACYQYLLMIYCGTTPGLRMTRLYLSHFDGSAVPRKRRRWRVLASILSCLSLGLGYAWCFLDEDQLCWHDRITRTYIAPMQKTFDPRHLI